ncbi:hypothetical protein [Sulfodiicoccus acidiphilus]|nr:hypothetical protein [Sulfodiicoccus acidiphilus]
MKEREVEARKLTGKKVVKGRVYQYEYYTLPLNLYVPKSMVEKFGTRFYLQVDEDSGIIIIRPKGEKAQ